MLVSVRIFAFIVVVRSVKLKGISIHLRGTDFGARVY